MSLLWDTAPLTETVTWETTSDWDSSISETDVHHPSSVLELHPTEDTFNDLSDGDPLPSIYSNSGYNVEADTGSPVEGGGSMYCVSGRNEEVSLSAVKDLKPDQIKYSYRETSSSKGHYYEARNASGDPIFRCGTNNPGTGINSGNGDVCLDVGGYNEVIEFTITFDWENNQFDVTVENKDTGDTKSLSGEPFMNDSSSLSESVVGDGGSGSPIQFCNGGAGGLEDTTFDLVYGVYDNGQITTSTKSYSSPRKPDLENLDYTLNGETIVVDVIGSPGTASEEVVTQTLGGSQSYSLSWSNAHTDFRVRPELSTSDRSTTPTVNSISLTG